ncbi:MAG: bifunctional riboflavin kinase/FAD synthetase [Neomegalonema sp.]|nr:bifunctional riboflavin kinase/FAD synthetase [Neomegalonema sp.]
MQVWRGLPPYQRGPRPVSVALGNFDGVHRGHRAVIEQARAAAIAGGLELGVITFEPHPREVFRAGDAPFRLTLEPLKLRRLAALGVEHCFVLPFDTRLSSLSPEEFCRQILREGLAVHHVVVGEDFRFGKGRKGDVQTMSALGAELGFSVDAAQLIGGAGAVFTSSAVRDALREGQPQEAARILGDWHRIEGPVLKGDQRGRELGYPTANMGLERLLQPKFGIYAVRVAVLSGPHQGAYDAVASLGLRPTFDKTEPNFEVHLFDFSGDLYGETLSVSLIEWLRPEIRFDGLAPLVTQMDEDSRQARLLLADAREPWLQSAGEMK